MWFTFFVSVPGIYMRVDITVWGNAFWDIVHTAAWRVEDTPLAVGTLLTHVHTLFKEVPCSICEVHALGTFATQNHAITTRKAINVAMWQFHNVVNARNGKPRFSWEEYVERYSTMDHSDVTETFRKVTDYLVSTMTQQYADRLRKIADTFCDLMVGRRPARSPRREQVRIRPQRRIEMRLGM